MWQRIDTGSNPPFVYGQEELIDVVFPTIGECQDLVTKSKYVTRANNPEP